MLSLLHILFIRIEKLNAMNTRGQESLGAPLRGCLLHPLLWAFSQALTLLCAFTLKCSPSPPPYPPLAFIQLPLDSIPPVTVSWLILLLLSGRPLPSTFLYLTLLVFWILHLFHYILFFSILP